MSKVIVVGGGASGMLAAGRCAELGNEVYLFEKNNILGKKIYITGKGRCNVTNAGDVEEFMENIPGNPYFLYSSLYLFDNAKLRELLNSFGVPTKEERGKRVFPESDMAKDIVSALERYVYKNKVHVHTSSEVKELIFDASSVKGVLLSNGREFLSDAVIIATGGLSYPGTGSTGDGYRFAKSVGHTVTALNPSLVPLKTEEAWVSELMGLSLKSVGVTFKDEKSKEVYSDFGELLFTHFGVSGPVILSASRSLIGKSNIRLFIDLKPALDEKTLDLRLLRDFEKHANKDYKNALDDLLPQKLIPVIINLSGISPEKKIHDITKEERKKLLSLLKALPLTISGPKGFDEAVITSGGVSTDEINPKTMESKKIRGLYFAGELIDVDAYTGGFNLQIAFSTGYAAGSGVNEKRE
ncbi:MAG: NAD(P)/FAD-dependent oxidoreductase [Lachnospiraceae bacterium]|nr:NAD(P)/FAD-dependent oxidoreductase [Lachnospiraceae bacterium]